MAGNGSIGPDTPVRFLHLYPPVTVDPAQTVRQAAETMLEHGIRHLLVAEDDRIVGQVTAREVVRMLIDTV